MKISLDDIKVVSFIPAKNSDLHQIRGGNADQAGSDPKLTPLTPIAEWIRDNFN